MPRVTFAYWGRRGLTPFVHGIAHACARDASLDWRLVLSRQNADLPRFAAFGDRVETVRTYERAVGALAAPWRLGDMRRTLAGALRAARIEHVVMLMPHLWSQALHDAARDAGAAYHTVLHDAARHPGDRTGLVSGLLLADAARADTVFCLSGAVAETLATSGRVDRGRIEVLFHPVTTAPDEVRAPPAPGRPWKLLFLGRILPYKGLGGLVGAVEMLRAAGVPVSLTVMGEGRLGPLRPRLDALGADVVDRWLDDAEIDAALASHHLLVLPYVEASQSGPAALALGAGLPIIATPVGGLPEQIAWGRAGVLAQGTQASELAEAIARVVSDPPAYDGLVAGASDVARERSADRFLAGLLTGLAAARTRQR